MTIYQRVPAGFADLSKNEKWCLLGIMIIGVLIRLAYCWDKPYLEDEVGTLMFIKKDISYLLSHFITWLGMNYFIALEKIVSTLLGENALGLRLVPMTAGIAIIPLTALLAINFTSHRTAMAAAALTALNPYFPEPRKVTLGELNHGALKHDSLKSGSATLYFVSSDQPVKTVSTSRNFGKVQVIVYEPSGRDAALGKLRRDLLSTVSDGKKLGPEFASLYKNIWHINNALGVETARRNLYYYNLWIKCFELTQRQKNIPFNLQKSEAQRFLKGMK